VTDANTGFRVGIDVGGTFTDLVCVTPEGHVVLDKTPTTPDDQSVGVMTGVAQLAEAQQLAIEDFCVRLDALVHGTTTADNTMIEMDGANTGLLVTEGHRDEIELRRVHKEEIWDPSYPAPAPIARRRARIPIPERVDFEGNVVLALDEDAVRKGVQRLKKLGCTSIAVTFLHSFTNPAHELRARELVREEFPDVEHISLSHEVMPRAPEFERTSTTLVNAYVAPRIAAYTGRLTEKLRQAGYTHEMLIMQSTGGVMPPDYVARRAVTLLGSGPTGGVMGASLAAQRSGIADFVAVDMGGTSYDVCLVRGGQPEIKTDWNWRYRYYIGLPMVDVQSVGAGGGSIAHYLPLENFAGGRMTLDVDAAREAIQRDVADQLGVDVIDAAWGIERIVNANMANAVRKVLSTHGADPRDLSMIAYGGNGPVHAWAQAPELGIGRILVPKAAPAFSALGLLVADYLVDLVRAYVVPLSQVDVKRVTTLMHGLLDEARKELEPANLGEGQVSTELYAQMCYPGQNFDMSVPVPEGPDLTDAGLLDLAGRFHAQHEADRGFSFPAQQPLLRGVRLVAKGFTPKPGRLAEPGDVGDPSQARKGTRPVHFGQGFVDTPVYDGTRLGPGAALTGPALVEEPFTVVVVAPGSSLILDEHGNYDIRVG